LNYGANLEEGKNILFTALLK